jgi:dihydroflavonol-4-reductase
VRALVTGASGFVGSHLVDALVARGDAVTCLVRPTSNLRWLPQDAVSVVHGDVTHAESLGRAVTGVDVVFHLAGMLRGADRAAYYAVNAEGARNLARACVERPGAPPFLVCCSTQAAGGPAVQRRRRHEQDAPAPVSDYGHSKLAGETAVIDAAGTTLRHAILRPPAVYGPRDIDILMYFRLIARGLAVYVGDGRQAIDLVYVTDVVAALLLLADSPNEASGVYYVNDGGDHTWRTLAADIATALDKRPLLVPIPAPVIGVVAFVAETVASVRGVAPTIHRQKVREFRQDAWICDSSRLRNDLGFENTYNVSRGVRETACWYREQGWI